MKTNKFYDVQFVKQNASGRWLSILLSTSPTLAEAIKKIGKHVACPVHGGKDGFRLFKDAHLTGRGVCNTCGHFSDGFELIQWVNGVTFLQALNMVAECLNIDPVAPKNKGSNKKTGYQKQSEKTSLTNISETKEPKINNVPNWVVEKEDVLNKTYNKKSSNISENIKFLWNKSLPINCDIAEPLLSYFRNRGVVQAAINSEESDCIRFHPGLAYYEEKMDETGNYKYEKMGEYPALICAIRDEKGEIISLHRTYLATKGGKKAQVKCPRKMMEVPEGKTISGASIRLGVPKEGILGVAEGVETALSAFHATGIPTWSTVNAGTMESFIVPQGIHTVLIWADKDKSKRGETAAGILSARLRSEGVRVYILTPNRPIPPREKGIDWNDVLLKDGLSGFPRASYLREFLSRNT